MKINSFHRLYVHHLKDIYNAEQLLLKALPKMANACSTSELKDAFNDHLEETNHQVERLEKIFENLGSSPTGEKCQAMQGLIEEGEEIINDDAMPPHIKDAGLIAAAQKIEHYEIASYGTVATFAKMLNQDRAKELLGEILAEEKNADALLTKLAESQVNQEAIEEERGGEERPSQGGDVVGNLSHLVDA